MAPIDDSLARCGFLKEELEVMTKMAVRVMAYEEPADQIFTFDKRTDDVDLFVENNADIKKTSDSAIKSQMRSERNIETEEGAEPPGSYRLLSDQLEKTIPHLVDPQVEYNQQPQQGSNAKMWKYYGAVSASIRDDNFQNMVHDEYVAQLAYDSCTTEDRVFVELSAVVKSVQKASYPLSGDPGCVMGVMVTHYNKPEDNNKAVLFRTMLKSNFPGISKSRL